MRKRTRGRGGSCPVARLGGRHSALPRGSCNDKGSLRLVRPSGAWLAHVITHTVRAAEVVVIPRRPSGCGHGLLSKSKIRCSTLAGVGQDSHTSLARALVWLLWIRETTAWDRCSRPQGGICALGRGMATGAVTITTPSGDSVVWPGSRLS